MPQKKKKTDLHYSTKYIVIKSKNINKAITWLAFLAALEPYFKMLIMALLILLCVHKAPDSISYIVSSHLVRQVISKMRK